MKVTGAQTEAFSAIRKRALAQAGAQALGLQAFPGVQPRSGTMQVLAANPRSGRNPTTASVRPGTGRD